MAKLALPVSGAQLDLLLLGQSYTELYWYWVCCPSQACCPSHHHYQHEKPCLPKKKGWGGGGNVLPATDSPPIYPCATPLLLMISHHRLCLNTWTDPYNRSFWVQLTRPYRRLFKNLFQCIVNTKWFLPQEKNDAYHHLYRQIRSLIFDTHTSIHTCARIHTHTRAYTHTRAHTHWDKERHPHTSHLST